MSRGSFPGRENCWAAGLGRWELSRALVAGVVEVFADIVEVAGFVVGWGREFVVGSLEIVRRCRALVEEPCQSKESVAVAPFDFVFVAVLDFVFVAVLAGIARGFRKLVGFSLFPQVVR